MNITLMLADAVHVADGKFYILGGGWSVVGPMPAPSAIAMKLEVMAHELDRPHHWELFLEDADGQLVMVDTPDGPQAIEVRGDFTASADPEALDGTAVTVPLAINFGPIPLTPASRFTWRLVVDGESLEGSTVSFSTRPMTPELL